MPPAPCSRAQRMWLGGLVVVAFALRLAWVIYAAREPKGLHDPTFYSIYGEQIARGNGYTILSFGAHGGEPTAYYPVGYPAVLAVIFWVMWHTPLPDSVRGAVAALNLVLGVATVVLVFEVGRRLLGNRVGLVAAAVVALWPNLVFHTAVALTETLFNFLVMAALLVLLWRPWDRPLSVRQLVGFGALVGLSALVRPISPLFVPALMVAVVLSGVGWRRALRYAAVVSVAAAVVIAPWTIRNLVVMRSPVLISTNFGDNLCIGRHPGATGGFDVSFDPAVLADPRANYCFHDLGDETRPAYEIRRNAITTRRALRYLVGHPLDEGRLLFLRAYQTMRDDRDGLTASESYGNDPFIPAGLRGALGTTADVFFFAAVALGLFGLRALATRRDPRKVVFLLALAALASAPLVFFGDVRFHVPLVPLWSVAVAVALVALWDRARRRAKPADA